MKTTNGNKATKTENNKKWNVPAILSLVFVGFPLLAPILAIVGLVQIRKTKERGAWLAILAILLNIVGFILLVVGITLLIVHAVRLDQREADRLGVSKETVSMVKRSVDGNCNIAVLESGYPIGTDGGSFTENIYIEKVSDNFAIGDRKCSYINNTQTFISKNQEGTWKVIFTGDKRQACARLQVERAPESLLTSACSVFVHPQVSRN